MSIYDHDSSLLPGVDLAQDPAISVLKAKLKALAAELKVEQERARELKLQLDVVKTHTDNVWKWQGKGWSEYAKENDVKSLACPVVMHPDVQRSLASAHEHLQMYKEQWKRAYEQTSMQVHEAFKNRWARRLNDEASDLRAELDELRSTLVTSDLENKAFREALWLSHGHIGQYGDDGEMQCAECLAYGMVDYKREPATDVIAVATKALQDKFAELRTAATRAFREATHADGCAAIVKTVNGDVLKDPAACSCFIAVLKKVVAP